MPSSVPILERAFTLARSGECHTVAGIKVRQKSERYAGIDQELQGLGLRRQLKALCEAARREPA